MADCSLGSRFASLDGQEATGIDIMHASDLLRPIKLVILYYTERINPDVLDTELSRHLEGFIERTWKLWSRNFFHGMLPRWHELS